MKEASTTSNHIRAFGKSYKKNRLPGSRARRVWACRLALRTGSWESPRDPMEGLGHHQFYRMGWRDNKKRGKRQKGETRSEGPEEEDEGWLVIRGGLFAAIGQRLRAAARPRVLQPERFLRPGRPSLPGAKLSARSLLLPAPPAC